MTNNLSEYEGQCRVLSFGPMTKAKSPFGLWLVTNCKPPKKTGEDGEDRKMLGFAQDSFEMAGQNCYIICNTNSLQYDLFNFAIPIINRDADTSHSTVTSTNR